MAIYSCSISIGSRGKGQSAIAAAAYRSGEKLKDNITGKLSDYSAEKERVVHSEIMLCKNAPPEYADRAKLWNAVHEIEKSKDARLFREIMVALPREFTREQQIDTVREYVRGLTAEGMCADFSIHDPKDVEEKKRNPHAHIMLTTRSIKDNGEWAAKSRKVFELNENGKKIFQKIDKDGRNQYKSHKEDYNNWNEKERAEEWREAWATVCNKRLQPKDHIDHRSFKRQGKQELPTIHEGFVAQEMKERGAVSVRCKSNERIRDYNEKLRTIKYMETEVAAQEWQELTRTWQADERAAEVKPTAEERFRAALDVVNRLARKGRTLKLETQKALEKMKETTATIEEIQQNYGFFDSDYFEGYSEDDHLQLKNLENDLIIDKKEYETALAAEKAVFGDYKKANKEADLLQAEFEAEKAAELSKPEKTLEKPVTATTTQQQDAEPRRTGRH